jgi:hypothetical protein
MQPIPPKQHTLRNLTPSKKLNNNQKHPTREDYQTSQKNNNTYYIQFL